MMQNKMEEEISKKTHSIKNYISDISWKFAGKIAALPLGIHLIQDAITGRLIFCNLNEWIGTTGEMVLFGLGGAYLSKKKVREEKEKKLLYETSIRDELTKLYNRRHLEKELEIEVSRTNRYERDLSLLMTDIDHFKKFNDTYGHRVGDEVLSGVAEVIAKKIRTIDSAYRYGGEEFTVLMPETELSGALIVAEKVRKAVEEKKFHLDNGQEIRVTISIGAGEYKHGQDLDSFFKRTDQALYKAKSLGRNQVAILDE